MSEQDKCIFNCATCGGTVVINSAAPSDIPECCGAPMGKQADDGGMDQCTAPSSAQYSRHDNFDDACDDGRAGR